MVYCQTRMIDAVKLKIDKVIATLLLNFLFKLTNKFVINIKK